MDEGRGRPALWPLGLGAALLAALYGPALAGRPLSADRLLLEDQPLLAYIHAALRAGRIPLWAPEIYAGYPLFAHMQTSFFYPPALLAGLLGSGRAEMGAVNLAWIYAPHLFLCLAATYFLALRRGLGTWGAAAAAFAFGLSGPLQDAYVGGCQLASMSWFPAVLWATDRACDRRRLADWAAAGAALGMSAWAGHAQYAYFAALAAAAWSAYRLLPERRFGAWVLGAAATAAVAAGLAAVQLLPTAELAGMTARARMGFEELAADSLAPRLLPRWLWPVPDAGAGDAEIAQPIGFAAVLLALLGAASRGRDRAFWLAAFAAAFALALGRHAPVLRALYDAGVPGIALFKAPVRFDFVCFFALSMLAGAGTRALLGNAPGRTGWAALAAFAGLFLLACLDAARAGAPATDPGRSLLYHSASAAPDAAAAWEGGRRLAAAAAFAAFAAAAYRLRGGARLAPAGAALLAALALPQAYWRWTELSADDAAREDLALSRSEGDAPYRKFSAGLLAAFEPPAAPAEGRPARARALRAAENGTPNLALLAGERDLSGFLNLPYARFLSLTSGEIPPARASAMGAGERFLGAPPLVRALNLGEVRRVVRDAPGAPPRTVREPVDRPLPRLWFASELRAADSERALLDALYDPAWRPEGTVWLEGERAARVLRDAKRRIEPGEAAEVLSASFAPGLAETRVRGDGRSALVFAETRHPGWRARIDGVRAEPLPANYLFQALAVPAGEHDVRWEFDPLSFRLGWFATAATLAMLGVLLGQGKIRGRRR